jgi:flagellar motor switch protein FliG
VASFKGGVKEAAKMLAGLAPAAQKSLLEEIKRKDPVMAAKLEENMVSMEDLQYLTASMLVGLLRDIDLEKFGLSLRTIDQAIPAKLLAMVSTGIRLDIEDGLKGKPRKVSEVEEAQKEVLDLLRKKIDLGHIVINPNGDELV